MIPTRHISATVLLACVVGWLPGAADTPDTSPAAARSRPVTSMPGDELWPSWSPDGTRIVFGASQGAGDIFTANPDGSDTRIVSPSPDVDRHPRWTRDGQIVFESRRTGNDDVYIVNPDGSGLRQLTSHPAADGAGAMSPQGDHLAFSSKRGGAVWELYTLRLREGIERRIATSPQGAVAHAWKPDGTELAFMAGPPGNWDIYTARVDGSPAVPAVATGDPETAPQWSPDGSTLLFTRMHGGRRNLFIKHMPAGAERQLTQMDGGTQWSTWCADGRAAVFAVGREGYEDLHAVRIEDGKVVRLTSDSGREISPSCDSRGRVLYSAGEDGQLDIRLLTLLLE